MQDMDEETQSAMALDVIFDIWRNHFGSNKKYAQITRQLFEFWGFVLEYRQAMAEERLLQTDRKRSRESSKSRVMERNPGASAPPRERSVMLGSRTGKGQEGSSASVESRTAAAAPLQSIYHTYAALGSVAPT